MNNERLKELLTTALKWIEEECSDYFLCEVGDEYYWFEETIGITENEMKELGIDWLSKGEENEEH